MPKDATYVGSVVLELDGVEFEVMSFRREINSGRRRVNTMNSGGVSKGYAKGIAEYNVSFDAPVLIDKSQDISWEDVTASKLTYWPLEEPNRRKTMRRFAVETAGDSYSSEGEATVSVSGFAFGVVDE